MLLGERAQDVWIKLIHAQVNSLRQPLERTQPVELQATGGFHPNEEGFVLLLCVTSHQLAESVMAPARVVEAEPLVNFPLLLWLDSSAASAYIPLSLGKPLPELLRSFLGQRGKYAATTHRVDTAVVRLLFFGWK